MRGRVILVIGIVLALSLGGVVSAQEVPMLPGAGGSAFGSYLNDQPPVIGEVVGVPATPKAGERVSVTAIVANDMERTDDTTEKVSLYYSTDGGKSWTEVKLEQGEEDETKWSGDIPGQSAGTKVVYYISALDTAGNLATEMPGLNTVWPPVINKQEPSKSSLPLLAVALKDDDDPEVQVPDGADFLTFAVGYNQEFLFGKLEVQGKITPGTLSPTSINAWGAVAINTDRSEDILKAGVALLYAPLAKTVLGSMAGITKDYAVIDARIADSPHQVIPYDDCGADCVVIDKALYWKFKRSLLGENPSNMVKFIGATAVLTATEVSALLSGLAPYDATCYISAYLREHSYTVGK